MLSRYKAVIVIIILFAGGLSGQTQKKQKTPKGAKGELALVDSTALRSDSLGTDTASRKNALQAPVDYQATDSMIMTGNSYAYLFGESDVKYQNIELQSELIEMNLDSSLAYAKFGLDSIGEEFGYPLFKNGDQQYESKTMRYNFKTEKGYITDVITQQGEGYVTAGQTKKMTDGVMNMKGGQYTTCDEHDHPHFYIQMTKAKIRPGKNIVTGPVYMVFEDVPLYPLGLPFCFFPFSDSYSSGILMPSYGDESSRGFFLRDGGYYFALSDHVDLALTGEIYTKGSWGLNARSSYKKRYKFSGNLNASYIVTRLGDKGLPDYSLSKDFKLNWTHTQDSKANPYFNFSASVNFATQSYDRNNSAGYYGPQSTQNTKGSSVSFTKRFPNNPFSISGTMNINQVTRDSSLSVTLPDITITMSRIFPFKRKKPIGPERWYEKISVAYTGNLRNSINTKENMLFKSNLIKDWKNAMQHNVPISASFTVLKYISISPSFNYKERWYTTQVDQYYDPKLQRLAPKDTTYGFYRVYDYSGSISLSTTMYGFFKPLPFLGKKVDMIRHRIMPSVSFSAAPDFGSPGFGYYKTVQYTNTRGENVTDVYSPFQGALFGLPSQGKQGSINFSVENNVEMKVVSDKDSTGFRKISLIDKLSADMSYNMVADSFKWSDLGVNLRLKLSKNYTLDLRGSFDTYTYDSNGRKVNIPRWQAGKGFGRLRSTGMNFSYTLNNETFKKWFNRDSKDKDKETDNEDLEGLTDPDNPELTGPTQPKEEGGRLRGNSHKTEGDMDNDGYFITTIPWSLSFNYDLRLGYGSFNKEKKEYNYLITQGLSFNGDIQPTKNWRLNFNATYDFTVKKVTYMTCNITRNMHCWQITGSFMPMGLYKSYSFTISASSSLLKDLKYDQRSDSRAILNWY